MSKINPSVPLELGGKLRHLKLDLNAMASFEEVTGQSLFGASISDISNMGARALRALIWSCLLHEEPDLTVETVGGWVDINNLADIAMQLNTAIAEAMPEAEGVTDKDPLPPKKKKPRAG